MCDGESLGSPSIDPSTRLLVSILGFESTDPLGSQQD
jgi:hypothetical protein